MAISIKKELQIKLEHHRKNNITLGEMRQEKKENMARNLIDEFLIPKFREIFLKKRIPYISVSFHEESDNWYYTTSMDLLKKKVCPYAKDLVVEAINLAADFDIETDVYTTTSLGVKKKVYKFFINLDK